MGGTGGEGGKDGKARQGRRVGYVHKVRWDEMKSTPLDPETYIVVSGC